jgi:hypothetical protein
MELAGAWGLVLPEGEAWELAVRRGLMPRRAAAGVGAGGLGCGGFGDGMELGWA